LDKVRRVFTPYSFVIRLLSKNKSIRFFPKEGAGVVDLKVLLPEVIADPANPETNEVWVLKTMGSSVGGGALISPMLLFTLPGAVGPTEYNLSWQSVSDGIKRVELT